MERRLSAFAPAAIAYTTTFARRAAAIAPESELFEPRSWPSVSRTRIRMPFDMCARRADDSPTAS